MIKIKVLIMAALILVSSVAVVMSDTISPPYQPNPKSVSAKWFWANVGQDVITLGFQSEYVIIGNGVGEINLNYFEDGRGWVWIDYIPGKFAFLPDARNLVYVNNIAIIFDEMLEY